MGPFLYLIYTFDLSLAINILVGTFTDDADEATVLATHEDPTIASHILQITRYLCGCAIGFLKRMNTNLHI